MPPHSPRGRDPKANISADQLESFCYIGKGGQGLVYAADLVVGEHDKQRVAVKLLRPELHGSAGNIKRYYSLHNAFFVRQHHLMRLPSCTTGSCRRWMCMGGSPMKGSGMAWLMRCMCALGAWQLARI